MSTSQIRKDFALAQQEHLPPLAQKFSPHRFSRFFSLLEKQPEEGVLYQLEIQIFCYSRTNTTYLDGAGQVLGLAISWPRNSLANDPISTISAYPAMESGLSRLPHDTYTTFWGIQKN